jgi:hypothetical protein
VQDDARLFAIRGRSGRTRHVCDAAKVCGHSYFNLVALEQMMELALLTDQAKLCIFGFVRKRTWKIGAWHAMRADRHWRV